MLKTSQSKQFLNLTEMKTLIPSSGTNDQLTDKSFTHLSGTPLSLIEKIPPVTSYSRLTKTKQNYHSVPPDSHAKSYNISTHPARK